MYMMKSFLIALALLPFFVMADDIEIYFNEGADSVPHVLLLQDMSSNTFSVIRGENITSVADGMTDEAYQQLLDFRDIDLPGCTDNTVTRWEVYRAILATVLRLRDDGEIWDPLNDDPEDLLFGDLKVALAASNHKSIDGGTILLGYTRLSEGGVEALLEDLGSVPCDIPANADAHDFGVKDVYLEWFNYINGYQVEKGMDTASNFTGPDDFNCINPDYDETIIEGLNTPWADCGSVDHRANPTNDYISPFDEDSCPALYSIVASMTGNNEGQDGQLVNDVDFPWDDLDGNTKSYEMIEYMHRQDTDLLPSLSNVNIPLLKTWVITDLGGDVCDPNDVNVESCGRSDVGEMAVAGGTAPLDLNNGVLLQEELEGALKEVLSVSSSFVSASVPVNVFNQTQSLDNLFISLFEAQNVYNWPGNAKRLRLNDSDGDGRFDEIVDANDGPGFETTGSNKGRIYYNALTFWTDTDPDALPSPTTGVDPNNPEYIPAGVDGRVVDRGGAGQQVPGVVASYGIPVGASNGQDGEVTRTVFLENATADGVVDFSTSLAADATIQGLLGASTETQAINYILWGRGLEVNDPNSVGNETYSLDPLSTRDWILGDSIHSRPFALNYGDTDGDGGVFSASNPNIILFFGTGNGSFHGIQNKDSSGNDSGKELFAYYPRELLSQLKYRQSNTGIDEGTDMRYGVDGAPVVLTYDDNNDQTLLSADNDEAYVYFGLRRGGYSYHALDVIDPNSPSLAWKITHTRDDGSDATFDELGLTFSTPAVTKVSYDGNIVDVLVFGGGYYGGLDPSDPEEQIGKDSGSYTPGTADAWGNAVYIVNARTGALIWKVVGTNSATPTASPTQYEHPAMDHSIPSDVTILENESGLLHRIYVGDTGGSVWRIDTPSGSCVDNDACVSDDWREESWFASRLADLSNSTDIRFFHAPDVIEVKDETTGQFFDAVIIQGGNRADPLDARFTAVQNYLYYLRDYEVTSGASTVIATDGGSEVPRYEFGDLPNRAGCDSEGTVTPVAGTSCEPLSTNGWKLAMDSVGEKGLSTPLVDGGRIFSSTYVPASGVGVCGVAPEGFGRLYITSTIDGTPVYGQGSYELGPGIPPSPVVIGESIWLPGGGIDADLDGDGVDDKMLTESITDRLVPIYWREVGIDEL